MNDDHAQPPAPKQWSLRKLIALAFVVGFLLFVLVWLGSRGDYDFYTAGESGTSAEQDAALPAPIAPDLATDGGASGLQVDPAQATTSQPASANPGISERLPAPVAPAAAPVPAAGDGLQPGDRATPTPLTQQPPRYPTEEQRRGIGGIVRVRIHVATDGSVESNDIATSSGSRGLDRAALEATRRWTFQPATRNGQPIAADVVVPIEFRAR